MRPWPMSRSTSSAVANATFSLVLFAVVTRRRVCVCVVHVCGLCVLWRRVLGTR